MQGWAVVKYKLGWWKEVQDLFARAYDIQSTKRTWIEPLGCHMLVRTKACVPKRQLNAL